MCLGFRYIWRHILHPGAAGEPPKIPSAWWKVPLRTLALLAVFPAPWEKARSHIFPFSDDERQKARGGVMKPSLE